MKSTASTCLWSGLWLLLPQIASQSCFHKNSSICTCSLWLCVLIFCIFNLQLPIDSSHYSIIIIAIKPTGEQGHRFNWNEHGKKFKLLMKIAFLRAAVFPQAGGSTRAGLVLPGAGANPISPGDHFQTTSSGSSERELNDWQIWRKCP